jgi:DNA-directed RNA polymerase beta' subunit
MRKNLAELLKHTYEKNNLFVDKVIVIPPEFRPMYQDEISKEWIIDKLNDIYQIILKSCFQLRSMTAGSLYDLLTYSLQNSVQEHHKFIRTRIEKKQGLIRQQLLGKRVDFSGRAVITPEPDLKIDQIGIPVKMAAFLFEPFIIYQLLHKNIVNKEKFEEEMKLFTKSELSLDSIQKVLKNIKFGDDVPPSLYDMFIKAIEAAIYDRVVVVKRDPVLQTASYLAYKPVLHHGSTLKMCNLLVGAHNADFDGDTVAIFHPLTNEAQEEVKNKMFSGTITSKSSGFNFELSKEMLTGLYIITKSKKTTNSPIIVSKDDLENATDAFIAVKYKGKITTMGKAIFNSCFPSDFPFQDVLVTKKVLNDEIIPHLSKKYNDINIIKKCIDNLHKVSNKWVTILAPSISIDNFDLPTSVYKIKEKIKTATPEETELLIVDAQKIVEKHIQETGLGDFVYSGGSKGLSQVMQILVAKGIIADPQGNVLDPIASSYSDGLSNKEFFNMASGSRKGEIDRSINTAETGYLSRKLAYLLNSIEADRYNLDCKTNKTLTIKLTNDIISRIKGRYIISNNETIEFDPKNYKVGSLINLRSPIFCKSLKICYKCYGKLLSNLQSPYIGLITAQVIGERGTQQIMRTFHTGGQVELIKRDILQDIINNNTLIKLDKNQLKKYMVQKENTLIIKKDCLVVIDLTNYDLKNDIDDKNSKIWFKSLIAKLIFDDLDFEIILDYQVYFNEPEEKEKDSKIMKLSYKDNSNLFEISSETSEIKNQIRYVERLLGGREIVKDSQHLYNKLLSIYSPPLTDMDSVHIEVLCSQVLRNKQDIQKPARIVEPYDAVLTNIKNIIFSTSFINGLAFENIGESLRRGLIQKEEMDTSIIEKLVTGNLLPLKTGRK